MIYESLNPANLVDVVSRIDLADSQEVCSQSHRAFVAQQSWAQIPAPMRGVIMGQVGQLIRSNLGYLSELITREIGKTTKEARGEVQEALDTCDFFLGEGRRLYGQTVPSEMPNKQLFTIRRPVGTAFIITAGNFPVAVPSWYLIPALLCGNSVVWKPAEYAATTANAFAQLFYQGGVPDDVLVVVNADGQATFNGLEQALDRGFIQKVGFTGSSVVGSAIGELCGRYVQSPCLELGGKNPFVVMEDADIDLAVDGALFSGFGTAGQRCTSLGTAIVHDAVYEEFIDKLTIAVDNAAIGSPDQQVLYGPLLDEKFAKKFDEYLDEMILGHHRILGSTGIGRITDANPRRGFIGDHTKGVFYHPTIVADVLIEDEIVRTETFGPMIAVARASSFEEALRIAKRSGYGLSSAIYTRSSKYAFSFAERIGAGMTSINNSTSGAEAHLPFGGNGKSGNGSRQSGMWVLDQFTRWQAVNWDYSGRLQRAQIDIDLPKHNPHFRLG